jgi:hypothetical protein
MSIIYIGIDDTDIIGSKGTGRVAKELAQQLIDAGLGISLGVSRHQLLADNRIPFTSHNSSKGLAFKTESKVADFFEVCLKYMKDCLQDGADPGLCICTDKLINHKIINFGEKAKSEVLTKQEAIKLAKQFGIFLREIGGTGGGIIGALASVGLRASGNDGRLVDLKGIKDIKGIITVGDLIRKTDIIAVQDEAGIRLNAMELIDSLDWIRPSIVDGQPILKVKPVKNTSANTVWQSVEIKHKHDGEHADD